MRPRHLLLACVLLAGCSSGSGSADPGARGTNARSSAPSGSSGTASLRDAGPPVEQPLSHFERLPVDAAAASLSALGRVLSAPDDARSYMAFRRAVSWGEPFFRERAPMAEALYGAATKGATMGALSRLDAAVEAGDRAAVAKEGDLVRSALQKVQASFERERARQARVPTLLPRAAYALGEILAASKPGVASSAAGVVADAQGHVDAIEQLVLFNQAFASVSKDHDAAANRVQESLAKLKKALRAAEDAGELSDRARLIVLTGRLGADIRSTLGPSSDLWSPYPPAVSAWEAGNALPLSSASASPSSSSSHAPSSSAARVGGPAPRPRMGGIDEPTSVLTVPRSDRLGDIIEAERAPFLRAEAPIDRFARGDEKALSDDDRRGFDVLAGKGRCTRCHAPPLFGVRRALDLAAPIHAVIGVPKVPAGKQQGPDPGRGAETREPADNGSFVVPTLRNVDRTAPYFHNGALPTLESVVDFFDEGGGRGAGLDVPNQHPDVRKLGLSAAEKKALLRFLHVALTEPARAPK